MSFYELIVNQSSADNQQRILAETVFNDLVRNNASLLFEELIRIASDDTVPVAYRQASLLHLKRLVPKHWSALFPSFLGPNCISQPVKSQARSLLLHLIVNSDSKIRSSASYAIIQIALVDYPDEWPDLLDNLYRFVESNDLYKTLGGLAVLRELFDDLVTDEQFFEGQVGKTIVLHCSQLLCSDSVSIEIKVDTLKLFQVCLQQLSTQLNLTADRKSFIRACVEDSLDMLVNLLNQVVSQHESYSYLAPQLFKLEIYHCLNTLSNNFNHLFTKKITQNIAFVNNLIVSDLQYLNETKQNKSEQDFHDFQQFAKFQVENFDVAKLKSSLFLELLLFANAISPLFSFKSQPELLVKFVNTLVEVSVIPEELAEEWRADFNSFVTEESGLNIEFDTRAAVADYLTDLAGDYNTIFMLVYELFNEKFASQDTAVELKESLLFVLGALFQNEEDDFQFPLHSPVDLLNQLLNVLQTHSQHDLLVARLILIVPRFFTRFENQIDGSSFGLRSLQLLFQYQASELTKAAILISFTYFNYFLRSSQMNPEIQLAIIGIVNDLKADSEEDANIILLESLSTAICIDNRRLAQNTAVLKLILEICYKDPSNLGLVDSGRECLSDLFAELPQEEFLVQSREGLPILVNMISEPLKTSNNVEFSPVLDLTLEFLITFIDESRQLDQQTFQLLFPVLTNLIVATDDDQLLQISNELFNALLTHDVSLQLIVEYPNGVDILLQIVSKYLSPDLSDQLILNVGSLVIKLIQNFAGLDNVSQYLDQILQTVTKRLILAKEFPTIENLILIFAHLAINSPRQTLDFLTNFEIENSGKLVNYVLPIWLQTFETVRGYAKIVLNIRAFIEIFLLKDPVLDNVMVNSDKLVPDESLNDKIITRSMRKNLKFIQIPASLKVIKLFINELKFQLSQPTDAVAESAIKLFGNKQAVEQQLGDAAGDDDWEDVNEYEEFAEFDDDDDHEGHDHELQSDNTEELQLLKSFFKKIGADEYFQGIFNYLESDEKRILTDFVNA